MAATSWLQKMLLCYASKPVCDRQVFRAVSRIKPQKIVEFGLGNDDRGADLIELAQRQRPTVEIQYTGFDWFDSRPANQSLEPLTLKDAHQTLKATGATCKLIPGDPVSNMRRVCNEVVGTDLMVISAEVELSDDDWFFLPRMLDETSVVFRQSEPEQPFDALDWKQVQSRFKAAKSTHRRAA